MSAFYRRRDVDCFAVGLVVRIRSHSRVVRDQAGNACQRCADKKHDLDVAGDGFHIPPICVVPPTMVSCSRSLFPDGCRANSGYLLNRYTNAVHHRSSGCGVDDFGDLNGEKLSPRPLWIVLSAILITVVLAFCITFFSYSRCWQGKGGLYRGNAPGKELHGRPPLMSAAASCEGCSDPDRSGLKGSVRALTEQAVVSYRDRRVSPSSFRVRR